MDARTLFGIASNTKAFTATALGLLVEEGKIEWDAPVVRYLPWFQMWDPYVTRELTIRDLLVHRSGLGLGAGDLLWWPPSTYDRKEIARRLRFIPPATSFRSAYAYDNVLYLVAGEVIEADQRPVVGGLRRVAHPREGRDDRVERAPFGGDAGGNVAATHARVDGKVRPIAPFVSDNTNPAGGINSNAEDMAKWMHVLLAQRQAGRRLAAVLRRHGPAAHDAGDADADRRSAAGAGAAANEFPRLCARSRRPRYRGQKLVTHTGGLPGYVSRVAMLPEANSASRCSRTRNRAKPSTRSRFTSSITTSARPPIDWLAAIRSWLARRRRTAATESGAKAATSGRFVEAVAPAREVRRHVSRRVVRRHRDQPRRTASSRCGSRRTPSLVGDLEHWQHDTFVVRWRDRELRADAYVTFALNPDGTIDQAKMQAVSPATDFSFDFQDLLLKPMGR